MTTAAIALRRPRIRSAAKASARRRPFPIENTVLWTLSFAAYIAVAYYVVFRLDYLVGDGAARVANASYVMFSRDPHLGAIAGVWPPLPAFLDIPILLFKGIWPELLTRGFAGCIESAAFGAGTVVLLNSGLKWAGVVRGMRWVFCAVWLLNPEMLFYDGSGMAEAPFIFFAFASILLFLRWCDSRRTALLPLLGVAAGLGCLCRIDMFPLAALLGAGVLVRSVHRGVSWREVETKVLLYALPAFFVVMLWIGSLAILERNPFFFLSQYSNAGVVAANNFVPASTWGGSVTFVARHIMVLFPAVVGAVGLLGIRLLFRRDRLPALMLLTFGMAVPLLDVYLLHKGEMSASLRYQIVIIPYAFLVCVYILRGLRRQRAVLSTLVAPLMAGVLALSGVVTGQTLSDPGIAYDEWAVLAAAGRATTVHTISPAFSSVTSLASIGPKVAALDKDHGLVAVDTSSGFWVVMSAPDPKLFVISSDLDFEGALAQPQVYHVEYFLVAPPVGLAAYDRMNLLYPGIYQTGAGFSKLVGDLGFWRLYRIIGPTGRG
jgi:hypothetical protein